MRLEISSQVAEDITKTIFSGYLALNSETINSFISSSSKSAFENTTTSSFSKRSGLKIANSFLISL
jgi:hypothetical protein